MFVGHGKAERKSKSPGKAWRSFGLPAAAENWLHQRCQRAIWNLQKERGVTATAAEVDGGCGGLTWMILKWWIDSYPQGWTERMHVRGMMRTFCMLTNLISSSPKISLFNTSVSFFIVWAIFFILVNLFGNR